VDSLEQVDAEVRSCTRCRLHATRTHAVPGHGAPAAALLLLGEAPGAQEDATGLPFQGTSGRFLDRCLADLGWGRGDVFVTGSAKCRPPGNRDPRSDEVAACAGYLDRQLALIRPRLVLAMGLVAAVRLGLARRGDRLGAVRGALHEPAAERPWAVLATYHPAAAMRFPRLREPFLADLAAATRRAAAAQYPAGSCASSSPAAPSTTPAGSPPTSRPPRG
jgi:uracil-DNA glycosylase